MNKKNKMFIKLGIFFVNLYKKRIRQKQISKITRYRKIAKL